jgi:hypothetical protein
MWVRLHCLPRTVSRGLGEIDEWDTRSKYYYERSLSRYLSDPLRSERHKSFMKSMGRGEMGVIDSFRIIKS